MSNNRHALSCCLPRPPGAPCPAGYALLFESMLDSVLHARDAFLRPGGAVLPDLAHIYVVR